MIAQLRVDLRLMTEPDAMDHRIVRALAGDGRISNLALAEAVGLSPSARLRRVTALEHGGRSPAAAPFPIPTRPAVSRCPEVRECHNITGAAEYLLRVEARHLACKRFHTEVPGPLPQVGAITSCVVMGLAEDERA